MTAELNETEQRWLEYARTVVSLSDSHARECESEGGSPAGALRWPGYLGRNYRPGVGALCVGQVHREGYAASENANPEIDIRFGTITESWKNGKVDDAIFLSETRDAYEYWIPRWSKWKQQFRYLVQRCLGLHIDEIAWANLAKCNVPEGRSVRDVVRLCQREFPIANLVQAIRPSVVLCCDLNAYAGGSIVRKWGNPLVFTFHGRRGTNSSGETQKVWGPRMANELRLGRDP